MPWTPVKGFAPGPHQGPYIYNIGGKGIRAGKMGGIDMIIANF